ncbi:EARLY FLOWERING MYB PROTEIN, HRS1 HOMOLOG4 [Hibiscus trionum]|uniref:EARLY FLOWERING MYB PROTEIN, HRS1 HOMOLOG4 n=1 Tax=Hibiscus trionum TaxID=183268 RepID=A0A9W7M4I5_HIBTR|nr:EARLY FLOWERING MYB PROTEIN, HRS1 HOMOLOG4 [Hibiscus trionum]
MASSPFELTLDCKPHSFDSQIDHKLKLEDFLSRLEEERIKIDAFKRELPLCMQLLTNALEASRHQLQTYRGNQGSRPVLEEFMPLNNLTSEKLDKSQNMSDHKANWMTTAQLWSEEGNETKPQSSVTDIGLNVGPNLGVDSITKQRNGGAFLPSSKDRECSEAVPDLALASLNKDMEDRRCNPETCQRREEVGTGKADGQTTNTNTNQLHRKARRCWSPELHRRFVNALHMLGGSQVATPKQIRELMKVDGLTNDEVKSHLQKYRLHTRTPSPSPQAVGAPAPQLVVLGGIWVPPEYATAAHSGGTALYGGHHTPPHFCAPGMPQEFYRSGVGATPALRPPPQLHQYQYHNMYNAAAREDGSIEDGKSESSSWKGERTGLAALREEGEECNRCEITLKF